jgi:hypothetical protein
MEIGMLWFDDGPNSIQEKVNQAVAFYTDKFGKKPTHCLVNPATLNGGDGTISGIEVKSARTVMPDHYWVGIEEQNRKRRSKSAGKEPTSRSDVVPEEKAA